jgi:hypothetical protein
MLTFEAQGFIDKNGSLQIIPSLDLKEGKVKVVIIYTEDSASEEALWLQSISSNPVFNFLADKEEDIYSINDGKPFYD